MKSRSEHSTAGRQQKMEGVNMPASFKFARRWLVGATAAAMFSLAALPGVGHATNIEICISGNGRIRGINLGVDNCAPGQMELDWVTTGPAGPSGPGGVPGAQGDAGPQGPQGVAGPTGPTGPAGIMGEPGIEGQTGAMGQQGVTGQSGTPGIPEDNISVFTGGSLGTFGALLNVDLSGNNAVGNPGTILELGPGNGSDTSGAVAVPMSEAGTALRLFVNVDMDPGTQMNNGIPSSFFFFLCDGPTFPSPPPGAVCGLACSIVGPDTTCSDLLGSQAFAQGDLMTLWAFADYPGANHANVKWSVTYDHSPAFITPPAPPI